MEKPLGGKNYGSIGHLPGSRLGPGDHRIPDGQARILLEKVRDRHDRVIVQEKLDGSNVGILRTGGRLIAITRAGYEADSSPYEQHRQFADYVLRFGRVERKFLNMLGEGERLVGEWMVQAHGTRYHLPHLPFVAFDLFREGKRILWEELKERCRVYEVPTPALLHEGGAFSIEQAEEALGTHGHHGAIDPAEGAVWRVERQGRVDFLGKYVRAGKEDGCFLDRCQGPVMNRWPA